MPTILKQTIPTTESSLKLAGIREMRYLCFGAFLGRLCIYTQNVSGAKSDKNIKFQMIKILHHKVAHFMILCVSVYSGGKQKWFF